MELISRKEARCLGLLFYYTEGPCVNNHLSKRYVKSGACFQCKKEEKASIRHVKNNTDYVVADYDVQAAKKQEKIIGQKYNKFVQLMRRKK